MIYEYLCDEAPHLPLLTDYPADTIPCPCGGTARRRWSVSFHRSMPEHFNHSVGRYVSNESDFSDALKQKSEEATEKTGIPHNFAPVDLTDTATLGVTEDMPRQRARTIYTP